MTSRPTGIRNAPPMPWTTRQAVIMATEVERAQSREPNVNREMANRKVWRDPNLSETHPEAGISTHTVSM